MKPPEPDIRPSDDPNDQDKPAPDEDPGARLRRRTRAHWIASDVSWTVAVCCSFVTGMAAKTWWFLPIFLAVTVPIMIYNWKLRARMHAEPTPLVAWTTSAEARMHAAVDAELDRLRRPPRGGPRS